MSTEIDKFHFDENIFWQKLIFAGKNYFCKNYFLPVRFYHGKNLFFPPSAKNLPTLCKTMHKHSLLAEKNEILDF